MQVVCIAEWGKPDVPFVLHWPVKGCIYTIRNVEVIGDTVALWLQEVQNPPVGSACSEVGFSSRGFRPLRSHKTDIGVFQKLLVPSPKELA